MLDISLISDYNHRYEIGLRSDEYADASGYGSTAV